MADGRALGRVALPHDAWDHAEGTVKHLCALVGLAGSLRELLIAAVLVPALALVGRGARPALALGLVVAVVTVVAVVAVVAVAPVVAVGILVALGLAVLRDGHVIEILGLLAVP